MDKDIKKFLDEISWSSRYLEGKEFTLEEKIAITEGLKKLVNRCTLTFYLNEVRNG